LQETSQGYRYEADGRAVNYVSTSQGYRYEADGRAVNNHPYSYDSTRKTRVDQMYPGNNNRNVDNNSSISESGDTIDVNTAIKQVKDIYNNPLPSGENIYVKHDSITKTI
jgi:hypothetical protein